jgi:type I restriction enzyme M protein
LSTPAGQVTLADIARVAKVSAAAVSNWRRRHLDTFPSAQWRDGQESFSADQVAAWLDHRKISVDDLKEGEPSGTTYGMRFRRNLNAPGNNPHAVTSMLWQHAESRRGFTDPAVFANLVLGLLYLRQKYPTRWQELIADEGSWFRVPTADDPALTQLDQAASALFSEPDGHGRLGRIIRLVDSALPPRDGEGGDPEPSLVGDVFGRLLESFADAEGKRAVVFTPRSVVHALVEMVSPQPGESVFDPYCESGGFLVEAARYVHERGDGPRSVSLAGQPPEERSRSLTAMNLALNGLSADLAARPGMLLADEKQQRQFDVILANPPFNLSHWGPGNPGDPRWRYGLPPESNANFAWLQHVVWSLSSRGRAAVIMPNGASLSERDRKIRAAMTNDGVVEAVIALPPQLFAATTVQVNVWLLKPGEGTPDEILFIDAQALGHMVGRSRRELRPAEIDRVAGKLHEWRERREGRRFEDEPGFAVSVPVGVVRDHNYVLLPGRYVSATNRARTDRREVAELQRRLSRLHLRAAEADAAVDRQLDRLGSCTR